MGDIVQVNISIDNTEKLRSINVKEYDRIYGPEFLRMVYRNVDLDDTAHRIIYI